MERAAALRVLGRAFLELGLHGAARRFQRDYSELHWLVDMELIPRTERVGLKVGACPIQLAPDGWPTRANDCPIIFYPESGGEPFGIDRWRVWVALDLSTSLADETRSDELRLVAESIVQVVDRVTSVADLKKMAARGELRGFLRKDARDLVMPGT